MRRRASSAERAAAAGLAAVFAAQPACTIETNTQNVRVAPSAVRAALPAAAAPTLGVSDMDGARVAIPVDEPLQVLNTRKSEPVVPSRTVTLHRLLEECQDTAPVPYRFEVPASGPACDLRDDERRLILTTQTSRRVVDTSAVGTGIGIGLVLGATAGFGYCLERCSDTARTGVEIGLGVAAGGLLLFTILALSASRSPSALGK